MVTNPIGQFKCVTAAAFAICGVRWAVTQTNRLSRIARPESRVERMIADERLVRAEPERKMRNDTIEFKPLTRHIGAEVHGVNLCTPLDDEIFRTLHGGLLEHLVLFFRDQDITHDQHVAFGRRFGELHIHPSAPCVDGRPELMKVHADATSPFAEGTAWHSDVSCDEEPPMASILHLSTVPSVGGDTLF